MDATQKRAVAVVYVAAMFMAVLDTTIVNVALPSLGRDLHAAPSGVGLVSVAYLVSLTVFIPVSGWLGDLVGGRRALLGAIAVFTIASALCGLSTSLGELVAFRVLQGVGGAVMTPVGLAMLFRVYPPAERVRVAGVLAVFTALGPALGPVLGGLFTTGLSWRWVFFVNLPVGAATLVFGLLRLDEHGQPHPGRLDVAGFALSGLGLATLTYGVSQGAVRGWTAVPVIAAVATGLLLITALVVVELRKPRPLVDLRLFAEHRLFAAATALYGLGSVAYLGTLYLAALFLQDALGLSALQAGLTTFPSALGVLIGGQLVTRLLYPRLGPRRVVTGGLLLMALTLALLTRVSPSTGLWPVRLDLLVLGLGVAAVFIPAQAMSMATIPKERTAQASPIFNAGKQLGAALGVSLLTTVVAAHHRPGVAADHAGFLAAAAVCVVSVGVALTIRDADAASTRVGRAGRPPTFSLEPSTVHGRTIPSVDDLDAATAATLAASRALLGVVAASLAPVLDQVTLPQFRVLVLLSELKRARIGDLAERLGVHPSTFSRTASRMVDADLVRRVESPHSRREILVELTPRGRRTVAGVVKRRATLIRDILSALEPAEREDLLSAFAAFTGAAHEPGYERLAGLLGI